MKFILLAATALIATPVIAQDTMGSQPPATTQTAPPTTSDPSTTTSSDPSAMQQTPTTPSTDPSMGQTPPPADPAATAPMGTAPGTSSTMSPPMSTGADPVGGYQPSQPAIQGQMQPGATVRFQPAPPAAQAYPAPAPLASYPICKRGQYDKCRQRGGR